MRLILQDIDEKLPGDKLSIKKRAADVFEEIAAREAAKPYGDFFLKKGSTCTFCLRGHRSGLSKRMSMI
ncbi:hypothetical protein [Virgibacillus sp. YIM 98842]|uniref:hypothetical protein n=1 Tax=Virgibacillus sp. YIM 98842 TaxID=2663533 RepID=UPI0013D9F44B|nr:hypothetical protein [Virgibacillus sp. YIM 98842]